MTHQLTCFPPVHMLRWGLPVLLSVCGATWEPTTAAAAATRVSDSDAVEIVAASPLRELNRAWSQCVDEALFIARINTETSIPKIEALVNFACEEYESRLAGELIKRQGYDRGSSVLAALKRKNRIRYEAVAKAAGTRSSTFYSQVEDWTIRRLTNGTCTALTSDQSLENPKSTILGMEKGVWKLGFLMQVRDTNRYQQRHAQLETVRLSAFGDHGEPGIANVQLRFEVSSGLIGWFMPMEDAVAQELDNAGHVQLQALSGEQYVERGFPVRGIRSAWDGVRKCAAEVKGSAK